MAEIMHSEVQSVMVREAANHVYIYVNNGKGEYVCYVITGVISSDYHGAVKVSAKVDDWYPDPVEVGQ